jgi:hypothetical protein
MPLPLKQARGLSTVGFFAYKTKQCGRHEALGITQPSYTYSSLTL